MSAILTVAIASENGNYDARVFQTLLSMLLQRQVEPWLGHGYRFSGWKSVVHNTRLFLGEAARSGVHHALLAIDNDGGSKRRLEHQPDHLSAQEAHDEQDGCAECLLEEQLPSDWKSPPRHCCIAVPVQTLETWLLVARAHSFKESTPEMRYSRPVLKKDFFGKGSLPETVRTQVALEVLQAPGALERLRERPSFQRFEARLAGW
jgi:hypothetical protein